MRSKISPSRQTLDLRSVLGAFDSVLFGCTVQCQLPYQSFQLVASDYHSTSFTTLNYRILVMAKVVILGCFFLFGEMIGFYGFYPFLQNVIKQVVCWRGHLTRVVGLEHVQSSGVIVSASTDCSVR